MNVEDKERDDEDEDEDENENEKEDDEDARERAEEHEAAWGEYKEALRDLKDQYQDMLGDWEAKMDDWEDQLKDRSTNGSFIHFAAPPIPPLPPVPPIHGHLLSGGRANVVASRIGDDDLHLIDMLLEAGIFATRSEAVAYLVSEGIKARRDMLEKVSASLEEIRATRKAAEAKIEALRQEIGIRNPPAKPTADAPPATRQKGPACPQCHSPLPVGNVRFCPSCGTKLVT